MPKICGRCTISGGVTKTRQEKLRIYCSSEKPKNKHKSVENVSAAIAYWEKHKNDKKPPTKAHVARVFDLKRSTFTQYIHPDPTKRPNILSTIHINKQPHQCLEMFYNPSPQEQPSKKTEARIKVGREWVQAPVYSFSMIQIKGDQGCRPRVILTPEIINDEINPPVIVDSSNGEVVCITFKSGRTNTAFFCFQ